MTILEILQEAGAVYTDDHLVLTSGRHSPVYINMRAIAPYFARLDLCTWHLEGEVGGGYDVVVGPETLGRTLAQAVQSDCAVWCDITGVGNNKTAIWPAKMGFESHLRPGMRAVIVDDLLTTGSSVRPVVELLRSAGLEVVAVAVVVRRNQAITAETLGVPQLIFLEDVDGGTTYAPDECPMCVKGKPLRLRPGHGWEFARDNPEHPSVVKAI